MPATHAVAPMPSIIAIVATPAPICPPVARTPASDTAPGAKRRDVAFRHYNETIMGRWLIEAPTSTASDRH